MPKKKTSMCSKRTSTECVSTECEKTKCEKSSKKKIVKNTILSSNKVIVNKKRGCVRKAKVDELAEINTECFDTECSDNVVKKKRGRPSNKKLYTESSETDFSKVKILKILGFCSNTECTNALTDGDYEEGKKTIVTCTRCGMRQKVCNLLDKEGIKNTRNVSKRAFLNDVTQAHEHIEKVHGEYDIKIPIELQNHVEDEDEDEDWAFE